MLEIVQAKADDKETMMNLLEKYLYEFSAWEKTDVDDKGNYGYEYLDCYFTEENRFPYFIKADGKLAGLILVSDYP
ncbi:MAG: GNAT family N-acetyltransferase, partial [Ruminiclostridium sp.]